ncbi:lipoprotein [Streptomyces amakusaensis]|uniref:Lipoprotein n=1 Tax=Streptomyces amakusaensis TaxID=67271 RepID=A0ABW0A9J2_9ACTN
MRARPPRPPYAALLAVTAAVAALAGCGDAGGLKSAGPTETATGPVRLWPGLPPVTAPPYDYGEADTALVRGVRVPPGGVRGLNPVAVLRAEETVGPDGRRGIDGIYQETSAKLRDCGRRPGRKAGEKPGSCPVLVPHHRDLTGDGREELIIGITMPEQQTAVRCYMPDAKGRLTRIMATSDQLVSVRLAGRDIILRSVSAGIPGYEYRTVWSWDGRHQAMLQTSDEIVRVKPRSAERPPAPKPSDASGPPADQR